MKIPGWMKEPAFEYTPLARPARGGGFIRKNLSDIAHLRKWVADSDESALKSGLLQRLDPAARMAGLLVLVVAASLSRDFYALSVIAAVTAVLAAMSSVKFAGLAKKVLPAFIFTTLMITPVFFGFFSPGTRLAGFSMGSVDFFVTGAGLRAGVFFIARVTTMASLVALLILTTRQMDFFRGIKRFPLPGVFAAALFMTFRYMFVLLKTAEDASMARRSRTIEPSMLRDHGGWFASRVLLFLRKSLFAAEEVGMAMESRGFTGRVRVLKESITGRWDYLWIGAATFVLFISLMA
ncbi:MAG: hypothetical protein BMS9Abin23_0858 [Thermodesulfobacteriota bacterium]|nr:MAG: hypothetical protein BMS9Abin23_0858 [Thermodesulfobacteriota bacterium]